MTMKSLFKYFKKSKQNKADFVVRKICKEAGINYDKVKSGKLDEVAWAKLTRAAGTISERLNSRF